MFLLVLLLPAPLIVTDRRWRTGKSAADSGWTIARIVSGFTLGHSLTLALASIGWLSVPSRPVEVLIAVSIIISSLHAWRPLFAGREIWIACAFGSTSRGAGGGCLRRELCFDRPSRAPLVALPHIECSGQPNRFWPNCCAEPITLELPATLCRSPNGAI